MKYCRHKNVVLRSIAGSHLLLPESGERESVFTLNESGLRLWEAIAVPKDKETLAAELSATYAIAQEVAMNDVEAFLREVLRLGLVVELAC